MNPASCWPVPGTGGLVITRQATLRPFRGARRAFAAAGNALRGIRYGHLSHWPDGSNPLVDDKHRLLPEDLLGCQRYDVDIDKGRDAVRRLRLRNRGNRQWVDSIGCYAQRAQRFTTGRQHQQQNQ